MEISKLEELINSIPDARYIREKVNEIKHFNKKRKEDLEKLKKFTDAMLDGSLECAIIFVHKINKEYIVNILHEKNYFISGIKEINEKVEIEFRV